MLSDCDKRHCKFLLPFLSLTQEETSCSTETHMGRNWGILPKATDNLEVDSPAPDDCRLCWHLDCNFLRPCTRTLMLSCFQTPNPQKLTDDVCSFKILNLGVVCYTAWLRSPIPRSQLLYIELLEITIAIWIEYEEVANSMNHAVKKVEPLQSISPACIWRKVISH